MLKGDKQVKQDHINKTLQRKNKSVDEECKLSNCIVGGKKLKTKKRSIEIGEPKGTSLFILFVPSLHRFPSIPRSTDQDFT